MFQIKITSEPRDTQHILVQEKESAFGIDCPINCLEQTDSLNGFITTTDSVTAASIYISQLGRKKLKIENSPVPVFPPIAVQQLSNYPSAMMTVDSHNRAIGPNLPTVSETVPVYYSRSQTSSSSDHTTMSTHENWKVPETNFQRRNSRRSIMKFSLSEKIKEIDDSSIPTNESSSASSDYDDITMASDSTCSSAENNAVSTAGCHSKHVSFLGDLSTNSSPLETRPRIQIRLMRVKAASVSDLSVTNQSISSQETDFVSSTENILTEFQNNKNTPCSDSTMKRTGYLKKIKTLFRPKSSKSLTSFMSASNEQINIDSKPRRLRSSSFSPISSLDNISDNVSESQTKQILSTSKQTKQFDESTASTSKDDSKISLKKLSSVNRLSANGNEEIVSDGDGVLRLNRVNSGPEVERSYSLLRSTSRDSATVSFTRIPSLRKRRSHVRLLYNFTTTLPAEESTMSESHGVKEATHIQVLKGGEAVVTDVLSNKLFLFDNKGFPKVTFAVESGSEPWATCVTPEGALAVTLKRQGCVSLWSTSGEPITEFGQPDLSAPTGIQCDNKGRFIVADEEANSVCVFNRYGRTLSELSAPLKENQDPAMPFLTNQSSFTGTFFNHPRYICITRDGHYVISDSGNHCIKIFDPFLKYKSQFGSFGKLDGQFKFPYGVAADDAGFLYVADHYNNRVSMFNRDGQFMEHVLTSADGITRPSSIAAVNSFLYVTHGDLRSNKISVFQMLKDHSNFL